MACHPFRASSDDDNILRQELLSVQRRMDQVTQEKEAEIEHLRKSLEEAFAERDDLVKSAGSSEKELINQKEETKRKLLELEESHSNIDRKENEIADLRVQLRSTEEKLNESRHHIDSQSGQFENDIKAMREKISHAQEKNADLTSKLTLLERKLEDISKSDQDHKMQCHELKSRWDETKRLLESRESEFASHEANSNHLRSEVKRLSDEKLDLLEQIKTGEGVSTAFEQLQEENVRMDT